MTSTPTLSEQLRRAIAECQLSPAELSRLTGIPESSLSRFIHRKAGLLMDSIDALGMALEAQLIINHNTMNKGL